MSYGITIHLKEVSKDDFLTEISLIMEKFNDVKEIPILLRDSYSLYHLFCKSEGEDFPITKELFTINFSKTYRCGIYLWEDLNLIGIVASDYHSDILKNNGYYKQYFQNSVDRDYELSDYSNMPFIEKIYNSLINKELKHIGNELLKISKYHKNIDELSDYYEFYEDYTDEDYVKRVLINDYIEELLSIQSILYSNESALESKNIQYIFNNSFYQETYDKFFDVFNNLVVSDNFYYE